MATEEGYFGHLSASSVTGVCQLVLYQMIRTYKKKGICDHWTEDVMKNAVKSVMRGNGNIGAASGLFKDSDTTLQKRAEASCL
jgi:hypothetical protein